MNPTFKNLLNEEQDPKSVEKLMERVSGLLTNGEEVVYVAVQKKPAVNLSPDCIAVTNKRLIFCRPKNLGFSMEFEDYLWKDVVDCHLKEGFLGAEITVKTTKGITNSLDYLPKAQARKVYQISQQREEEASDYRRQRDLEDKRAAAGGGIVVTTNMPAATPAQVPVVAAAPPADDPMQALQKLKMLLANELISQEEFDAKKAEILARL